VVRRALGISVEEGRVRAVALAKGRVVWAAEAEYVGLDDLAAVLGRLAAERPRGIRSARVALGADIAQLKVVDAMPRLSPGDLAAHVALQPRRYFLTNGVPLVTDAVAHGRTNGRPNTNGHWPALLAAAPEPLVEAVAAGVRAAGLTLECIAPASALSAESALLAPVALAPLGDGGARYFSAFAAAASRDAGLLLMPHALRRYAERARTNTARRWLIFAAASLVLAFGSRFGALARQGATAERELAALHRTLEAALAARRDLDLTTQALTFLARQEAERPHRAALLARVTRALPDSAFLAALRLEADGRGTLVGYAPRAPDVAAALERVPGILHPALEGPVTREVVGPREWDRFTLRFRTRPEGSP
jgi:hypothetical protein